MSDPAELTIRDLGTSTFPTSQFERRFEELAESLPGMVYQVATDDRGNVRHTYCSGNSVPITGLTPQQILEDPLALTKQVLPEDQSIMIKAYVSSMQDLKPFVRDFRIRHVDGSLRHLRTYATPKRTEVGCLWNGYTVDVTAEVESRARTEAAEKRLREITDTLPGTLFQNSVDSHGKIELTYVSSGIVELWGVDPAKSTNLTQDVFGCILAEDRDRIRSGIRAQGKSEAAGPMDFRIRHAKSGEIRWIRTLAATVVHPDGSIFRNGYWQDITDIKALQAEAVEARERLAASEQRMRDIIASVPGMVYQFRVMPDGTYLTTYVSEGVTRLAGIEPCEDAHTLSERLFPVMALDYDTMDAQTQEAVQNMSPLHVEFRIRHAKSGVIRWVRSMGTPQRLADGSTVVNGFWMDITERREIDEALHEALLAAETAERNVRDIQESLPGVVYRMVFEGANPTRFSDMTDGAMAIYGFPREAILKDGEIFSRCLHPDDRARMNVEFMNAMREKRSAQTDFRFNRPDGRTVWLRTYAAPRLLPKGVAWVGYTTDVTVEREAQERADMFLKQLTEARDQAQAAEQRLRAIFDHTKIGLVMIDRDKNFSNANPSLRELLLIEDEQEFARDFPAFSPPTQPDGRPSMEKAGEVIDIAFDTGYHRFDWMHQTRGGEPRPCEIALTRVTLGGTPHIFATMTDLRDRKRAEAALEKASIEAQAAAKAKGEFLANMSHEI
ncbi:MAG TPA: PAS domain-containing protein, partial [Nevskiaceae bacterium]|nr:PAS domain-containing protein [Nevskiaceae bacterium]